MEKMEKGKRDVSLGQAVGSNRNSLRCPDPSCPGSSPSPEAAGLIRPFGSYSTQQHGYVKRYRCSVCGKTFTVRTGTERWHLHRDDIDTGDIVFDWCRGKEVKEIAKTYGCTVSMIRVRLKRAVGNNIKL